MSPASKTKAGWPFVRAFELLSATSIAAMIALTSIDVVGRVLFSAPLGITYETVGILLGVVAYGALVRVVADRDYIRIDLFEGVLSRREQFDRVRGLVVAILELAFITAIAVMLVRQTTIMERYAETYMFVPVEKWIPMTGLSALVIVAALTGLWALFRKQPEHRPAASDQIADEVNT